MKAGMNEVDCGMGEWFLRDGVEVREKDCGVGCGVGGLARVIQSARWPRGARARARLSSSTSPATRATVTRLLPTLRQSAMHRDTLPPSRVMRTLRARVCARIRCKTIEARPGAVSAQPRAGRVRHTYAPIDGGRPPRSCRCHSSLPHAARSAVLHLFQT